MPNEDARIAAIRGYVLDYCLGLVWSLNILIAIPSALERIADACAYVNEELDAIAVPNAAVSAFVITLGILVPYAVGQLFRPVTSAVTEFLRQWLHRYQHRTTPSPFEAIDKLAADELEARTRLPRSACSSHSFMRIFLLETDSKSIGILLVANDNLQFRKALAFGFFTLLAVLTWRFGPDLVLLRIIITIALGALFVAHASTEHTTHHVILGSMSMAVMLRCGDLTSPEVSTLPSRRIESA